MNVKDKILNLNQEHTGKSADINDLLLTIITKFQLFEPCSYLSEDDEWLNVSLISIEDNSVGQALTIRKSEITTFGIFNREEIELNMDRWSIQLLDINGPNWVIYDYDMEVKYLFQFQVDFNDLEIRIKLEDLKLNVIHHIESLRDETTYRDNLTNSVFIK